MSFIAKEFAAEWWRSPDLDDVTILRFEEDSRFRFIWEAVGSGKTWSPDFGLNDTGGLVVAHNAVAVVSLSRGDKMPGVRYGKTIGSVPVTIWPLLKSNRASRALAKKVTAAFVKLGMIELDVWQKKAKALAREKSTGRHGSKK